MNAATSPGLLSRLNASQKPILVDFYCGGGGATKGYQDAGFYVIGVDIEPQPNYCGDEFIQADALKLLSELPYWVQNHAVHASPPCQDHTSLASVSGGNGTGWMLPATLHFLSRLRGPWVVENVVGAPLANAPTLTGQHGIELCGKTFGLGVIRHRLFQASFPLEQPPHRPHTGVNYSPAGHGDPNWRARDENPELSGPGYADRCREAMGIDWMNRDELAQAIPPAMTEFIGRQLLEHLPAYSTSITQEER